MERLGLRDDQWDRIKDLLPGREGYGGGTAPDNRAFFDGVLYRLTGIPWRDLPERFGKWSSTYQRFNRWTKSGVFSRIFDILSSDPDNEYNMIDSTIVRAHQHSAGAANSSGPQAIGRSRGGLTTKIHTLVDALGNPIERFFNRIKHFRAIATRYDKFSRNFLAGIHLISTIVLLN